jgi:6-phosphofructokinase
VCIITGSIEIVFRTNVNLLETKQKMAKVPKANAVVGQSGGPTGVINASLVGVIEQACKHPGIENLVGAVHGVRGIVDEQVIDLKAISPWELEAVAASPSSALGSSRDKPDEAYCERIFEQFKKYNVRYFFYIGGNDSANTAHIVNEMAESIGYDLRAFHVPKTVDNDLLVTDHCPGYGTAAAFVSCALMGDDLDNRALPGVKIDVIMGRHAGFLTAAAALGRQRDDDGPHLVYMPERPVSMEQLMGDVDKVYSKLGRCVVAVSEGITDTDGVTWAEKLAADAERDAHGNIQLSGTGALADFLAGQIKAKTDIKRVRAPIPSATCSAALQDCNRVWMWRRPVRPDVRPFVSPWNTRVVPWPSSVSAPATTTG